MLNYTAVCRKLVPTQPEGNVLKRKLRLSGEGKRKQKLGGDSLR